MTTAAGVGLVLGLIGGTALAAIPSVWQRRAALPLATAGACAAQAGVADPENLFIVSMALAYGQSDAFFPQVSRMFSPPENKWRETSAVPTLPVRYSNQGALMGGRLFCAGGFGQVVPGQVATLRGDTSSFNILARIWNTFDNIPRALVAGTQPDERRVGAAFVPALGKIFLIGGRTGDTPCTGTLRNDVLQFDPAKPAGQQWRFFATLPPAARRSDAQGILVGTKILLFGGCRPSDGGDTFAPDKVTFLNDVLSVDTKNPANIRVIPGAVMTPALGGPRADAAVTRLSANLISVTGGWRRGATGKLLIDPATPALTIMHPGFDTITNLLPAGTTITPTIDQTLQGRVEVVTPNNLVFNTATNQFGVLGPDLPSRCPDELPQDNGANTVGNRAEQATVRIAGALFAAGGTCIEVGTNNTFVDTRSRILVITAATNSAPIQITATAHGLKTGDFVNIVGVQGNIAANGHFYITVLDADNFTLNGSAANDFFIPGRGEATLVRRTFSIPILNVSVTLVVLANQTASITVPVEKRTFLSDMDAIIP